MLEGRGQAPGNGLKPWRAWNNNTRKHVPTSRMVNVLCALVMKGHKSFQKGLNRYFPQSSLCTRQDVREMLSTEENYWLFLTLPVQIARRSLAIKFGAGSQNLSRELCWRNHGGEETQKITWKWLLILPIRVSRKAMDGGSVVTAHFSNKLPFNVRQFCNMSPLPAYKWRKC